MPRRFQLRSKSASFWILVLFLGLTFLLGGGSREDIQSLIILRPVSVLVCGFAIWKLRLEDVREHRFLLIFAALLFALAAAHLVPLPAAVWHGLPGRELFAEIDRATGLGDVSRPLALLPSSAWNAFFSLFTPLAVLLLGISLSREERRALLLPLIVIGLGSGVIGLLQVIGPADGPLYLYRITNSGSAVGLFANRNHQAVFLALLFPMLATFALTSGRLSRAMHGYLMLLAALVLLPLILITGSRAGMIIALIGLGVATIMFFASGAAGRMRGIRFAAVVAAGMLLMLSVGVLALLSGRAEALQRLMLTDSRDDMRMQVWEPILDISWIYSPWGSGVGSFAEVYKIHEPFHLLERTYLNHAHNDWLEVLMTSGLPGVILLLIAVLAWARASWVVWRGRRHDPDRHSVQFGRLGSLIILLLGLASITDYPLRVPSLACVLVICALWLRDGLDRREQPAHGSGINA